MKRARLFAHRGARAHLPENTLEAFELGLRQGADVIETDVRLTSDSKVVIFHDPSGDRIAMQSSLVSQTSWSTLKNWDVGWAHVSSDGSHHFINKGYRPPLLSEALDSFKTTAFNVDIKVRQWRAAVDVVRLVNACDAADRVLLTSADDRVIDLVHSLGYRGQTGIGVQRALSVIFARGAVGRTLKHCHAAQLPHRVGRLDLGSRSSIERIHRCGLEAHFWTVNNPARAEEIVRNGADVVMTDDPAALVHVFKPA